MPWEILNVSSTFVPVSIRLALLLSFIAVYTDVANLLVFPLRKHCAYGHTITHHEKELLIRAEDIPMHQYYTSTAPYPDLDCRLHVDQIRLVVWIARSFGALLWTYDLTKTYGRFCVRASSKVGRTTQINTRSTALVIAPFLTAVIARSPFNLAFL